MACRTMINSSMYFHNIAVADVPNIYNIVYYIIII